MSQFFASDGQSTGASDSASVLPMNIQGLFPLGLAGLILLSKGLFKSPFQHNSKVSVPWCSAFFMIQLSHPYMTSGKSIALTVWTFVGKVMSLLFNMLYSRDITLPTKGRLVKTMVFPVVMYGCESWTVKKAEHRRIDAFELLCWRRLLRVP